MARMELSDDEEQKKLDARRRKLAEDFDKDEEGLEEQGLEDYVMPVKRAMQGGLKAAVVSAVKAKAKVKPPKDVGTTISYDKPFGGKPTVKHDKPLPGKPSGTSKKDIGWLEELLKD